MYWSFKPQKQVFLYGYGGFVASIIQYPRNVDDILMAIDEFNSVDTVIPVLLRYPRWAHRIP